MILYELLTLLITALNRIRTWHARKHLYPCCRVDRDLRMETHCIDTSGLLMECCDCGLTHWLRLDGAWLLHIVPVRPKKYHYRLRLKIKPEPKL